MSKMVNEMNEEKQVDEIVKYVNDIRLEEADYQQMKIALTQQIRDAMMQLQMSRLWLGKVEAELRKMWEKLPEKEREKRLAEYGSKQKQPGNAR